MVRASSGARLDLVPTRPSLRTRVPTVRIDDFRDGLNRLAFLYPEIAAEFAGLDSGTTILHTADVVSGRLVWIMVPSEDLPSSNAPVGVCAVPSQNELPRQYGFLYAQSIVMARALE